MDDETKKNLWYLGFFLCTVFGWPWLVRWYWRYLDWVWDGRPRRRRKP